jgi:hypothetical protein
VIVDDLDLLCMPFDPYEAQPPLAGDPDAVLAFPIMLQGLELVARGDPKEVQSGCCVQLLQLSERDSFDVHKAAYPSPLEQGLGIAAAKAQDHAVILTVPVMNLKRPSRCAACLPARWCAETKGDDI